MSQIGFIDGTLSLYVDSYDHRLKVLSSFKELLPSLAYPHAVKLSPTQDARELHMFFSDSDYYSDTWRDLEILAGWVRREGLRHTGYFITDVENCRSRVEFKDGELIWADLDWISGYSVDQIRQLEEYANRHFNLYTEHCPFCESETVYDGGGHYVICHRCGKSLMPCDWCRDPYNGPNHESCSAPDGYRCALEYDPAFNVANNKK